MTDGTEMVPAAALPDGWNIHRVAALVHDLAVNMYDLPVTLKKYTLTNAQYDILQGNEFFKKALESAVLDWNSPQSTQKRLALESAVAIEAALPTLAARFHKADEPLPGLVQLLKVFAELSGAIGSGNKQQDAPREKFKITINLGADVQRFEKDRSVANLIEVQSLPEGEGQRQPLFGESEAPGNPG